MEHESTETSRKHSLSFTHYILMKSRAIKSTIIIAIAVALTAIVFANRETIFKKNIVVGEFIPTNEWQEVLPGQSIPKVRMQN